MLLRWFRIRWDGPLTAPMSLSEARVALHATARQQVADGIQQAIDLAAGPTTSEWSEPETGQAERLDAAFRLSRVLGLPAADLLDRTPDAPQVIDVPTERQVTIPLTAPPGVVPRPSSPRCLPQPGGPR